MAQFLDDTDYIVVVSTSGPTPTTEILVGMTVGSSVANWMLQAQCTVCVSILGQGSNFIAIPTLT